MTVSTAVRPTTHDLIRFLLARVDDDVAELKRLARQQLATGADAHEGVRAIARLQAEAAAKRRMIGALQQLLVLRDQPLEKTVRDQATQMLRVLATPYDGHSAYRSEWRPAGAR
jgi:anti-sigma factor ChrR (cupin superfamily)